MWCVDLKKHLPTEFVTKGFLKWLAQVKSGQVGLHQEHPQGAVEKDEATPLLPPTAGHQAEEEEDKTI